MHNLRQVELPLPAFTERRTHLRLDVVLAFNVQSRHVRMTGQIHDNASNKLIAEVQLPEEVNLATCQLDVVNDHFRVSWELLTADAILQARKDVHKLCDTGIVADCQVRETVAWYTGPTPVLDIPEHSKECDMPSPKRSSQAKEASRSDHEEEPAQPEIQGQVHQATFAQPQEVEATKPTAWSKSFKEVVGHVRQPVMGPAKAPLTQKPPAPVVHLSSSAVQAAPVPKRALPSSSRRSAPRSALMADRVTAPPAPAVSSVQRPTAVRKAPIPLPVRQTAPASAAMKIQPRAITPIRPALPPSAPNVPSVPSSTDVKPQPKAAAIKTAATVVAATSASSLSMRDAGRLSARVLSGTCNELPRVPDDFTAQGHYVSDGIKVKRTYNQVRSQCGVVVLTVKGKKGSEVPFTAFILAEGAGKKRAPLHVFKNLLSNITGALTKSIHVVRAYNNASETS